MQSNAALDIEMEISSQQRSMNLGITGNARYITMEIERGTLPLPEYEGPYDVTPALYFSQMLDTQGKKMTDNVTVGAIPIQSVSNPQGGRTVTIGSMM